MTKEIFTKVYNTISGNIKSEVNGELCMNYACGMIGYCGGYELTMKPNVLMWGNELSLINAIANANCCNVEIKFYDGTIRIY